MTDGTSFPNFLCDRLLYANMSYCAKFQLNWNSSFHFMAIYSFSRFAFSAVRAEHTAATAANVGLILARLKLQFSHRYVGMMVS